MQEKSHEVLIKILNNIGIVGSILAGIADLIVVIIFVVGIHMQENMTANIVFAIVNAVIGVLINVLLRYQGQRYAELENEQLVTQYYKHKVDKEKRHLPLAWYNTLSIIKDVAVKGVTTTFSIIGVVYISIEGSKNPIQILITIVTLIMFACFGLISMNNAYCRYYNVQIPYMQKILKIREEKENAVN